MNWKFAGVVAGVVVVIVGIGIALAFALHPATPGTPRPGQSSAAPLPTPKPTSPHPAPGTDPADCIISYGDAGPENVEPDPVTGCLPPPEVFAPTAEQFAATPIAVAFAVRFASFDSDEGAAARSSRLAPFTVPGGTVAGQPTLLSRYDSGLVGLTGTASIPGGPAGFITRNSAEGDWVYTVAATFQAEYTQGTQVSKWRSSGTWTVTLSADAPHLVTAVTESIPAFDGT